MFRNNQNLSYERFYPASKRRFPSLKKICIFAIISIILIIIIVKIFSRKKDNSPQSINDKILEKKNINERLQTEINSLNSEISQLNQKSSELKLNLEKLQKEQKNVNNEENSELTEKNNKLSSLEKEFKEMEDNTKKLNDNLEKINKENKDVDEKIKELTSKLEALEKEKESKIKKTSTLADTVILTDDNIKSILEVFDLELEFNLLYRASKHGKEYKDFQKEIGKRKNLLIVGKTSDDLVLGGYITTNLEGDGFKKDKYAFLRYKIYITIYSVSFQNTVFTFNLRLLSRPNIDSKKKYLTKSVSKPLKKWNLFSIGTPSLTVSIPDNNVKYDDNNFKIIINIDNRNGRESTRELKVKLMRTIEFYG